MDDDKIKAIKKKKKNFSLDDFIEMDPAERKLLEVEIFDNPQQIADVEKALSVFPQIEINVEHYVEGEKEIAVGDVLTVKIVVTQPWLKEGEEAGFIHSNRFPFLKTSQWYLVFTDEQEEEFYAIEKIPIKERVYVKEIKEVMKVAGRTTMNLILMNDSYKGFDHNYKVEFKVM